MEKKSRAAVPEGSNARGPSLRDVGRSLRHHAARLREYPNVVALGVGGRVRAGKREPRLAIRVYVSRKLPEARLGKAERLPVRVRGRLPGGRTAPWYVEVDVVRGSGELRGLSLQGGQGIRGISDEVGTVALAYRTVLGFDYLLTNAHVAAGLDVGPAEIAWFERIGHSTAVTRPSTQRAFADVERITAIASGGVNDADAALCRIYSSEDFSPRVIGAELVVDSADVSETSAETYFYVNRRGQVKTFNAPDLRSPVDVAFRGRRVRFRRAFTLTGVPGTAYLVEPGDSGSLLVRRGGEGLEAAGLVFAGDKNTVAVFPFSWVLAKLGAAAAGRQGRPEEVSVDFGT